jgi:hypothetical protein
MDVDEGNSVTIERALRSEMVFAMSEELKVTCHAHLPVEVKQALKNAGEHHYFCPRILELIYMYVRLL